MPGQPVTIRTIDPLLHLFLPKREDLMVDGTARGAGEGAELDERRLLARVECSTSSTRCSATARPAGHHLPRSPR
jgi:hypothetical protein